MHPAGSVIALTTTTGAGYGLLAWLAFGAGMGLLPPDWLLGVIAFALVFALVSAGLLASTLHLGHPERAWRAFSQWRSSWLAREACLAVLTYPPALLFAGAWVVLGDNRGLAGVVGALGALLGLLTVYSQSMIYASLRTVPAWNHIWTPLGFLIFSLMTGSLLLAAIGALFALEATPLFGGMALLMTGFGLLAKTAAISTVELARPVSTAASATGLGRFGRVSLMEAPHSEANYLLREMGFALARRHARRLHRLMHLLLFALPLAFLLVGLLGGAEGVAKLGLTGGVLQTVGFGLAVLSATLGITLERWLFFAAARHVVTLYYGRSGA